MEATQVFARKLAVSHIPSLSELESGDVPDWPPGYDPAQGYRERQPDGSPWSRCGTLLDFLNLRIFPTLEKLPYDLVQEVAELINDAHSLGQESALLPFKTDMSAAEVELDTCQRPGCNRLFLRKLLNKSKGEYQKFCPGGTCRSTDYKQKNYSKYSQT